MVVESRDHQRQGRDHRRLGKVVLVDFSMMQEQNPSFFKKLEGTLALSLDRPVLLRDGQGYPFFKRIAL